MSAHEACIDILPRLRRRAHAPAAQCRPRVIWIYRHTLSLLVGYNCRHLPTCSVYGDEAIERFGLWAGGWMTLARLLRCQPWGTSGIDNVPQDAPRGRALVSAVALRALARRQRAVEVRARRHASASEKQETARRRRRRFRLLRTRRRRAPDRPMTWSRPARCRRSPSSPTAADSIHWCASDSRCRN